MKKASRTLVLRSETLRTLGTFDLARVAGGDDSGAKQCVNVIMDQSGDKQCLNVLAFDSNAKQCVNLLALV